MAKTKTAKKVAVTKGLKTTNYPVGDFLIRIKNAALAHGKDVEYWANGRVVSLAKVLKETGFLESFEVKDGKLTARLAYKSKEPRIMGLKLVSKPGLRIYIKAKDLDKRRKPSILIVSTPKGVVASPQAMKERLGGEVIAEVW